METPPVASSPPRFPRKVIVGLIVGWILIVAKCAATPYLIARWNVPVAPGWVIVPTLVFATLVSWLVVTHDWKRDEED
jgi:uncharacterized RDD family membrane protein YckC